MSQRPRILEIIGFVVAGCLCGVAAGLLLVAVAKKASPEDGLRKMGWVETRHVDTE